MNLTKYRKAQSYLESLPSIQGYMTKRRHPAFYLERMQLLLQHLQHPEKGFQYVHVTGTSGKGSVTMFLHNMLKASGKQVGSYLSPHTTTVVERILLNGKTTSVSDFVWGVNSIKPAITIMRKKGNEFAPSYFEALFAVALLIFRKRHINWIVLEVGCGGEFDATNTIPAPRVAIITNIHLDHMHLLGRTRAKIADTKAGVLKKGTHCFTGEEDPKIRRRILTKARKLHVPVTLIPQPKTRYALIQNNMEWEDSRLEALHSSLLGAHQLHNASLAIAVAKFLRLPSRAVRKGIIETRVPCRSEFVQTHPAVMLDGAHNPAKIRSLALLLRQLPYTKIHALIGIGYNKPAASMLKILRPRISFATFTQASVDLPQPMKANKLRQIFRRVSKKPSRVIQQPMQALRQCLDDLPEGALLLVTGSLYLAGEVRTRWISEQYILQHRSSYAP